ncbi:MAG: hypothetical protein E6G39_05225 [Actinobacteria bacterium]|nr:MAG: hypothetical protein E6G39_05225 [Actinomycetota bacterium]
MKAARLEDGTLHIRDLPVPIPNDGEALVRISASGVCHSDLHIARGDWYGVPRTGVIGHEAIGVVDALGPGADRFVQLRVLPQRRTSALHRVQRHHGHLRRVLQRVRAVARQAARQHRRPRSSARVRWPHGVRRGEEATQASRASRTSDCGHRRRRRPRPLRGANRHRVRLQGGRCRHR